MNSGKLRIFVTTSHISTVFMTLCAQSTRRAGDIDVMLVDDGVRRQFLLDLIEQAASFHDWNLYQCFSVGVGSEHDFKPSARKTLTRKLKGLPVIRIFYDYLLRRFVRKKNEGYKAKLLDLFAKLPRTGSTELFLMTNTHLYDTLGPMFPGAPIHYMEHGIGDYFYIGEKKDAGRKFHCVFEKPFRAYLEKTNQPSDYVAPIDGLTNFNRLAHQLVEKHRAELGLDKLQVPDKPVVFVLLEAVDMYNVPERFWKEYLSHITDQLNDPGQFHYLLKTHPVQSNISIRHTEEFFREKGFTYTLLAGEKLSSFSAETLFECWAARTKHVFCLFSSGCFYLSQLYQDETIRYWYSTEFMAKYISNAPPQYSKHFNGLLPMIENVFAERCKPY